MGMFNEYPYRNLTDLNLDYIFKIMKEVEKQVEYFVSLNAIKYADPIQWDITRQYEKNTIVIDPLTGTAYISVAPVPAGTALTRPEYWTVVFDLQRFVTKACKNFTTRYEAETTTTATFNTPKDGWLCWADVLYKANVNITAGDSYVPGGNITAFTIEDFGGHLDALLTTDKSNVVAAINELVNVLIQMSVEMGDLNDLTTVDKTSLVNAINELVIEISNAINIIGDLNDLTTTDKTTVVNAINEIVTNVGDLNDLMTSDKSSIVNAINDINSIIPPGVDYINVDDYGAVGDGITDDLQAFTNAITECTLTGKDFYVPNKTYYISDSIIFDSINYNINFNGRVKYTGNSAAIIINNSGEKTIKVNAIGDPLSYTAGSIGVLIKKSYNNNIFSDYIGGFETAFKLNAEGSIAYNRIYLGYLHNNMYGIYINSINSGWCNENIFIGGRIQLDGANPLYKVGIGIYIKADNGYRPNSNRFIKFSAEETGVAVKLDAGQRNFFDDIRVEKAVKILQASNNAFCNKMTVSYGLDTDITRIDDTSGTKTNTIEFTEYYNKICIYSNHDIIKGAYSNDSKATFNDSYLCGLVNSGGTPVIGQMRNFSSIDYCLNKSNNAVLGIVIDTTNHKQFSIKPYTEGTNYKAMCVLWDSSNNIISTGVDTSTDTAIRNYGDSASLGFNYWYSGGQTSGAECNITVPDTCVKMFIGIIENSKLSGFDIYACVNYPRSSIFGVINETNIIGSQLAYGLATKPTKASYTGAYCPNIDSANPTLKGWFYDGSAWQDDYLNSTP